MIDSDGLGWWVVHPRENMRVNLNHQGDILSANLPEQISGPNPVQNAPGRGLTQNDAPLYTLTQTHTNIHTHAHTHTHTHQHYVCDRAH